MDDVSKVNVITSSGDIRPVPDPTLLTNALVTTAKEEMRREMQFIQQVLETRLDATEQASVLLQTILDRIPSQTNERIKHLADTFEERLNTVRERFATIEIQFKERDERVRQSASDTSKAVDAALAAARSAVDQQNNAFALSTSKSEQATTKQLDQLLTLLQTTVGALDSKISDLKDRLTLIEGRSGGIGTSWAVIVGAAAIIGVLFNVLYNLMKH